MIDILLASLIRREGGYTNNPADRGGPTNWGITQQVARAYGYSGDMEDLPKDTALAIYRQRYWSRPGFDKIAVRYPAVAEEMFDTGVNMGPTVAIRFLQRALNLLNRGHTDYGDINTDGDLGPVTLQALDGYKAKRHSEGEEILRRALDVQQGARYMDLAEAKPSQEAFLYGWLATRIGLLS